MSIDLRIEFDAFLKQYGVNVYLQRVKTPFIDPEEGELKYSMTLEKHTVRSMNALASRFLGGVQEEQIEGIEYPNDFVFWFRWDVNPISGDRIYVTVPRYPVGKNPVYTIDYADPKYGQNGRIEFWAVGCTKSRPE